jgi:NAD(P)-dependent dehydrogenase (short-subunit alcohol dehydrogenase family)
MARGLARAGARVGVLGRREERAEELAERITNEGGEALPLSADVLERDQLEAARRAALERWGRIDILVNAAGGNIPAATVEEGTRILDLPVEAFREVLDLNLLGTLVPIQVCGEAMATGAAEGCVVNVSSLAAQKPLTKVTGYSAAKAAVENFTRWLAVEFARNKYGAGIRANAIAPGFFLGSKTGRCSSTKTVA